MLNTPARLPEHKGTEHSPVPCLASTQVPTPLQKSRSPRPWVTKPEAILAISFTEDIPCFITNLQHFSSTLTLTLPPGMGKLLSTSMVNKNGKKSFRPTWLKCMQIPGPPLLQAQLNYRPASKPQVCSQKEIASEGFWLQLFVNSHKHLVPGKLASLLEGVSSEKTPVACTWILHSAPCSTQISLLAPLLRCQLCRSHFWHWFPHHALPTHPNTF